MKRIIEFFVLVFLTFSACNYKADKPSTQEQYQEKKLREIKIERHFDVEPEKVYRAFTNPKDMMVWWTLDTKFDIDLRVGGQYSITREEDGNKFVMTGEYLEVERPHKLKYTCGMPDFSPVMDTITVEIQADAKGGCQLTFIQAGVGINEELKQLSKGTISETEKGWNYGFDLMEKSWKEDK